MDITAIFFTLKILKIYLGESNKISVMKGRSKTKYNNSQRIRVFKLST
jgi:hypothetical protein